MTAFNFALFLIALVAPYLYAGCVPWTPCQTWADGTGWLHWIFLGSASAETYVYATYGVLFMFFAEFRTRETFIQKASWVFRMIGVFYASPIGLFFYCVAKGIQWQLIAEEENRRHTDGRIWYSREHFNQDAFDGLRITEGASTMGISPNDIRVPKEMRDAIQAVNRTDPYGQDRRHVVVESTIELERGKPVIWDWVVTKTQIERMKHQGSWDPPQGYDTPAWRIDSHGTDLAPYTDDNGIAHFPAPSGLAHAFMSQFNGPKLRKVKRVRW